ncbi:MAG: cell envelope integrity protein CreD [Desulfovibrio sp.]|jgi:inner membrane protein|nr:cell envelope integrity protein CreD [Desulfovibrio sp.]
MTDSRQIPDNDAATGKPASPDAASVFKNLLHARFPSPGDGRYLSSPFVRCVFVGVLTLSLLIPLEYVQDMVYDRKHLYQQATEDIASRWGKEQTVSGPALIIPYQVWVDRKEKVTLKVNGKGEEKEVVTREYHTRHKVVLPSHLSFDTVLETEVRYRGIYKQTLYTAPMDIAGSFILPAGKNFSDNTTRIYWDQAWLSLGISDLKTIAEAAPVRWAGKILDAYKPGAQAGNLLGPGFHTAVPLDGEDAGTKQSFSLRLTIRGSRGISFTPVGENTTISMKSAWPAPSFQGNLLPVERTVSEEGFTAKWAISNLTRTYPQIADLDDSAYKTGEHSRRNAHTAEEFSAVTSFTAGVNLHEPVTLYRMVRRSVDYGILFIAVTFVALFVFEIISRRRMHLVQYAMVGLPMSLFYLVLLSLAEHVNFVLAFVAASAVIIAMNSLYVGAVLRSKGKGILMGGLLAVLYAVLFSLLRMEDFSLLMGTGLLLVMTGALMFATRKLPQEKVVASA